MKKKWLWLGLVFVLFSALLAFNWFGCGKKKLTLSDDNLLIITLDTTRADRVGAWGYKNAQTPNIDALAQGGVMFANCISPVPMTLPAHSSLFTGRYPPAHGVRNNGSYFLADGETTLAEIFKAKDYQTSAVIASFVLLGKFGLKQGFDAYDDSLNTHEIYNDYTSAIPASRVYLKFRQWFDTASGKRFFAWVHFYDPHLPYKAPSTYADRFPKTMEGAYDAEVSYMDAFVGKVIEALREKKILEKTLVVIAGDHGEGLGEHGEEGHGIFCYEELIKTPLIFFHQQLFKRGRSVNNRVSLVDVLPTLCDLYRIAAPADLAGQSLLPLLEGRDEKDERGLYFESLYGSEQYNWAPLTGISVGGFKYISLPKAELYDLRTDKAEKNNLFLAKNSLARELDTKLAKLLIATSRNPNNRNARRKLSAVDTRHLQALGYISSFNAGGRVGIDPKQGILLEDRAKKILNLIERKDFSAAEKALHDLAQEKPEIRRLPFYFDFRHRLYLMQNKIEEALAVIKQAVETFPQDEAFFISYAMELSTLGLNEKAETACRQILKRNPLFTRAHILLAEIAEKRQDIKQALMHYENALMLEPENISLRLKQAELLIQKGEYGKALSCYNILLKRPEISKNPGLLFKIALFNSQAGDLNLAERLMADAVSLESKGINFYYYALILAKNGKIDAAVKNMEIALNRYRSELNKEQLHIANKAVTVWKQER